MSFEAAEAQDVALFWPIVAWLLLLHWNSEFCTIRVISIMQHVVIACCAIGQTHRLQLFVTCWIDEICCDNDDIRTTYACERAGLLAIVFPIRSCIHRRILVHSTSTATASNVHVLALTRFNYRFKRESRGRLRVPRGSHIGSPKCVRSEICLSQAISFAVKQK